MGRKLLRRPSRTKSSAVCRHSSLKGLRRQLEAVAGSQADRCLAGAILPLRLQLAIRILLYELDAFLAENPRPRLQEWLDVRGRHSSLHRRDRTLRLASLEETQTIGGNL